MSTTVFEGASDIRQQHQEEFILLARRMAYGEEGIDAETIERVCTAAGKPIGEFNGLVSQCRSRQGLREDYARLAIVEKQMRDAQERRLELNRERQAALERHARAVPEVDGEIQRLVNEYSKLSIVPGQLLRSCPDQSLRDELKRLSRDRELVGQRSSHLRGEVDRLEAAKRQAGAAGDAQAATALQGAIERVEAQWSELDKKVDELARRSADVEKQMVEF